MKNYYLLLLFPLLLLFSCQPAQEQNSSSASEEPENPPAPGFHAEASDAQAIRLADSVMQAMGGRKAWDATRYLHWNFFGFRSLLWDKAAGKVRIESPNDNRIYLIDLRENTGKVQQEGETVTQADSLQKYVQRGKNIWINDSYWLVMPFKLKDSGVTLRYLGRDTTQSGAPAELLELTFDQVGSTPQNKYHVYVDPETYLVSQWDYFRNRQDSLPALSTPWRDYQRYGDIMLSGDRGQRQITEIKAPDSAPASAFESFDPISLD